MYLLHIYTTYIICIWYVYVCKVGYKITERKKKEIEYECQVRGHMLLFCTNAHAYTYVCTLYYNMYRTHIKLI